MADQFDPYREALVVETNTVWPDELGDVDPPQRRQLEGFLHAGAQQASQLEYVRLPTGFCRRITVTAEDVARFRRDGR